MRALAANVIVVLVLFSMPAAVEATWSIVAVDGTTGAIGIAAASCTTNVQGLATIVPNVGIAAVQAASSEVARTRATAMLKEGATAADILRDLQRPEYSPEEQQYAIITKYDPTPASFSGKNTGAHRGAIAGPGVSVQGNVLAGQNVLDHALRAYTRSAEQSFGQRLFAALSAGAAAGGDRRCGDQHATSAYITVYNADDPDGTPHLHLAVYGVERGGRSAVALLQVLVDDWKRRGTEQRSTRMYWLP